MSVEWNRSVCGVDQECVCGVDRSVCGVEGVDQRCV